MFKRALLVCLALLTVSFAALPFTFPPPQSDYAQPISLNGDKIVYTLPYPGLLPDHPLYILKIIRDRIQEFITRDNLKKAELYLLLSDKRIAMADSLSQSGKGALAVSAVSKAEKYFEKIPPLLRSAKKQGSSASTEFVDRLKLSNLKHREMIEYFMKELPQGQNAMLNPVLTLNAAVKEQLDRL